jgi:hypothetical protein
MSSHTSKLPALAVLATLFALLLAGCGGGGSSDSTSPVAGDATSAKSPPATAKEAEKPKPAPTPSKQSAKRKKASSPKHAGDSAEKKDGNSKPADAGADPTATDPIAKIKELVSGGNGTRVASSPKEIRKILRELRAEAQEGGDASSQDSIEKALEGVLGGD